MKSRLPAGLLKKKSGSAYSKAIRPLAAKPGPKATLLLTQCLERNIKGGKPSNGQPRRPVVGRMLELAVLECLVLKGLLPVYFQAQYVGLPFGFRHDFLLYRKREPVILSVKVSIAERWKQTGYESLISKRYARLSGIHNSDLRCYLLALKKGNELEARRQEIEECKRMGIDTGITDIIDLASKDWLKLLNQLHSSQSKIGKFSRHGSIPGRCIDNDNGKIAVSTA